MTFRGEMEVLKQLHEIKIMLANVAAIAASPRDDAKMELFRRMMETPTTTTQEGVEA